jgi:hypothetical protein
MKRKTGRKEVSSFSSHAVLLVMVVLAFGAGTTILGQTAETERSKTKKGKSVEASGSASSWSQQAAVDLQTGKLRQPSQDESQQMAEEMRKKYDRSPEKLTVIQMVGGAEVVQLTDDYMDVAVVKLNPDGTLTTSCVQGMKSADKLVGGATVTPAAGASTAAANAVEKMARCAPKAAQVVGRKGANR